MKDYGAIQQEESIAARVRWLRRKKYRSAAEIAYLQRVAGTSGRFQGLNQRQRRKRERQTGRR